MRSHANQRMGVPRNPQILRVGPEPKAPASRICPSQNAIDSIPSETFNISVKGLSDSNQCSTGSICGRGRCCACVSPREPDDHIHVSLMLLLTLKNVEPILAEFLPVSVG
jgi:hypothetical protein